MTQLRMACALLVGSAALHVNGMAGSMATEAASCRTSALHGPQKSRCLLYRGGGRSPATTPPLATPFKHVSVGWAYTCPGSVRHAEMAIDLTEYGNRNQKLGTVTIVDMPDTTSGSGQATLHLQRVQAIALRVAASTPYFRRLCAWRLTVVGEDP